jgi:hypothetical protein
MSHAAYMRDDDLFPRAAAGDGEALLAIVARHRSRVRVSVAAEAGEAVATAATARAFAALATGTLPPGAAAWHLRLTAVALAAAGDPALATGRDDTDILAALLAFLPEPQRAALHAAHERDTARHDDTAPLPAVPAPPPAAPGVVPPLLTLPTLPSAFPTSTPTATVRHGRVDRYVPHPSAARWLVPLALLAVICAYWVGHSATPTAQQTPTLIASWPTLPPRATREVAQLEPTPGATSTAPLLSVPAAPQTPTAPYGPMSGVIATGVGAPPAAVAPVEPTATEPLPPTATAEATEAVPFPTAQAPVARVAQPTPPPLPTAPPLTRIVPTATIAAPPTPTAPSPTAQASTPTIAPTTTPTTAQLALKTQNLGFGVEVGPRALVFSNPGNDPLVWRAVADSTWLDLAQASGTLRAGETQSVAINIARGDLPTGGYSGAVQVVSNGGEGVVPVTMAISPSNTVVSAFAEPSAPLGALGCAAPNTYLVSAEIAGSGTPKRAVVYYAINGGTQQTQDLTAEGRRYSTVLGPFSEPGNVVYSLVITEADGNVVRSASNTLTITDCPSRVRTVPVTPPATQPFTLAPGGRNIYTFNTVTPGSLVVTIAWQGDATRLSTLLYSPQRPTQPFEQRAGEKTLTFTFPVTAADIAAGGNWTLHLVNYESGAATGHLDIAFVPPGAPTPTPQGTAPATTPTTNVTPTATPAATPVTPTAPAPTATPKASTPVPTTPPTSAPAPATPTSAPATRTASGTPKP